VRQADQRAFLTIKGEAKGLAKLTRAEFEYEIPLEDAEALFGMCPEPLLEKRRHLFEYEGHTWEVDEFLGANAGLWVAEIELTDAGESFALPPWVGQEVTHDRRYMNSNLVVAPFSTWGVTTRME
jgi:adenylate cyclase